MGLKDKIRKRIQAQLGNAEVVHEAFMALAVNPGYVRRPPPTATRLIGVGDRGIHVYTSKMTSTSPKEHVATYPLQQLHLESGSLFRGLQLGADKVWIHKRFHNEVTTAAARIAQGNLA